MSDFILVSIVSFIIGFILGIFSLGKLLEIGIKNDSKKFEEILREARKQGKIK